MYRQWHHAAKLKRNELIRRLAYLGSIVTRLTADLTVRTNPQPSARAIQAELHEAENEFGEVRFDKRSKTLSVTTEHITLEGLELGRFEIRLNPTAVAANDGLDVLEAVALDPNPCSIDELITHPHVNDGRVCLGNASEPFRMALRDHRIADAFQLVAAVLRTYGANSPYCTIDNWDGRPCDDCGDLAGADNCYYCEPCDRHFCEDCFSACGGCGEPLCLGCLACCAMCDDRVCDNCRRVCSHCGELACSGCIEDELCPTCVEDSQNEETEDDEEEVEHNQVEQNQPEISTSKTQAPTTCVSAARSAVPAVQSEGMGEAHLYA
ncbi:MAG: hypothetical protein KDA89_14630 [Planctomycetaceae bacterium]|nr:hypothetical protein [Planctomycetaceae bacterium]